MSQMLDEILLIGRAEVGALVPVPLCFDLRDFCEALIESTVRGVRRRRRAPMRAGDALLETLPPSAAAGALDRVPVAKPNTPPVRLWFEGEREVCLDQRLLTHVLGNVLENALKYSAPDGEIGLRVEVSPSRLQLVVQDAGIGIDASDLAHLFGAFQRGKNVGTVGGSGLGLAAVKRALDAQGGSIEIQSEAGRGTTVSVWLPLAAAPEGADAAEPPTAERAAAFLTSREAP
jgi:signal transduction histidine kinase